MPSRRKLEKKVIEAAPALGAAAGLVLSRAPHPKPCSSHVAARCVGQTFGSVAAPYAIHALIGALVGLAVATALIVSTRTRQPAPRSQKARKPIPERVRHEVWRRDDARCVDCGSRARLEFDHIIPLSRGGSDTARNLELRCEHCNRRKGDRI